VTTQRVRYERPTAQDRLLTIGELASYLGVTERWVMDKAAAGELPSFKLGRYRRFRLSEVLEKLERDRA
jgi:excisionase family DNA binding protein